MTAIGGVISSLGTLAGFWGIAWVLLNRSATVPGYLLFGGLAALAVGWSMS